MSVWITSRNHDESGLLLRVAARRNVARNVRAPGARNTRGGSERRAARDHGHAGKLPTVCECVRERIAPTHMRNAPNIVYGQQVAAVEIRRTVVALARVLIRTHPSRIRLRRGHGPAPGVINTPNKSVAVTLVQTYL